MGTSDWRFHDLRRTTATGLADLGIAPHIVEAVLNHISGSKGGIAGVYNRSKYGRRRRPRSNGGPRTSPALSRGGRRGSCRCTGRGRDVNGPKFPLSLPYREVDDRPPKFEARPSPHADNDKELMREWVCSRLQDLLDEYDWSGGELTAVENFLDLTNSAEWDIGAAVELASIQNSRATQGARSANSPGAPRDDQLAPACKSEAEEPHGRRKALEASAAQLRRRSGPPSEDGGPRSNSHPRRLV